MRGDRVVPEQETVVSSAGPRVFARPAVVVLEVVLAEVRPRAAVSASSAWPVSPEQAGSERRHG